MKKKGKPILLIIPVLIVIIIVVFIGSHFLWNYYFDKICQEDFREKQFAILSSLNPLKNQTGLEFARTIAVVHTSYKADVKTPSEVLGVFCSANVLLCKKESGEIQYCQEYAVPFTAAVK